MPFDLDITQSAIYKMGHVEATRQILAKPPEQHFDPLARAICKRITNVPELTGVCTKS